MSGGAIDARWCLHWGMSIHGLRDGIEMDARCYLFDGRLVYWTRRLADLVDGGWKYPGLAIDLGWFPCRKVVWMVEKEFYLSMMEWSGLAVWMRSVA